MALMQVDFFSKVLGMCCQCNVILPQSEQGIGVTGSGELTEKKVPTLWLLHGASDDHTIWLRRTSIERYVAPLGIAVVMPAAHLSSYCNMKYGKRYYDYFTEELPAILRDFFPLSDRREDNFVAGLSMGGYGALKMGFGRPDLYSAIGCFSAGNMPYREEGTRFFRGERASGGASRSMACFGTESRKDLIGDENADVFAMIEKSLAKGETMPRVFHACGTEDLGVENARFTQRTIREKYPQIEYEYREGPGAHTWEFWDEWIQKYLAWLLPQKG